MTDQPPRDQRQRQRDPKIDTTMESQVSKGARPGAPAHPLIGERPEPPPETWGTRPGRMKRVSYGDHGREIAANPAPPANATYAIPKQERPPKPSALISPYFRGLYERLFVKKLLVEEREQRHKQNAVEHGESEKGERKRT